MIFWLPFFQFPDRGPGVFHLRYGTLRRLRPRLGPGTTLALAPAPDQLLHRSWRFGAGSHAQSAVGHWYSSWSHQRRSVVSMLGEMLGTDGTDEIWRATFIRIESAFHFGSVVSLRLLHSLNAPGGFVTWEPPRAPDRTGDWSNGLDFCMKTPIFSWPFLKDECQTAKHRCQLFSITSKKWKIQYLGVSENVVYPYTQWLMIIIPTKWL